MSIDTQNSWYMSKPLFDCPNLFSREETSEYQAHFYHCECGDKEVVLSSNMETPLYQCEKCDNTHFINASIVAKGYFYLQKNKNLNLIYECKKIHDGYIVNAYLNIPYESDFMRKRLLYRKKFIASLTILFSSNKHIFHLPMNNLKEKYLLKKKIRHFIIEDTGDKHMYYRDSLYKEENIYPFFFNPHLLDAEFDFWEKIDLRGLISPRKPIGVEYMLNYLLNHRKERSLKRVLFKKYTQLLKDRPSVDCFDPLVPFIISRCFDDPNIASKLLTEDLKIFSFNVETEYYPITYYDAKGMARPSLRRSTSSVLIRNQIWFIKFLKIHYSEKQLAKLLLEEQADEYGLWSDTLELLGGHTKGIKKNFEKVKLTPENLHDEIIRCTNAQKNEELAKVKFSYEEHYVQACTKIDNTEFKLPSTGKELETWAADMHNCISGYGLRINRRETTIYGAFRDDKMLYAIEASPTKINAMSGKYNSEISIDDQNVINQWWGKYLYQLH